MQTFDSTDLEMGEPGTIHLDSQLGNQGDVQGDVATESKSHTDEIELIPFAMKDHEFVEVDSSDSLEESLRSIPDRMAFKIGTAADLVGVKTYVLRFWETEFDQLRPKKSNKGQRVYSRRDVETAMMIKKLLYEDRFSIEGARARLRDLRSKVKEEHQTVIAAEKEKNQAVSQLAEVRTVALTEMRSLLADITRFRSGLLTV